MFEAHLHYSPKFNLKDPNPLSDETVKEVQDTFDSVKNHLETTYQAYPLGKPKKGPDFEHYCYHLPDIGVSVTLELGKYHFDNLHTYLPVSTSVNLGADDSLTDIVAGILEVAPKLKSVEETAAAETTQ